MASYSTRLEDLIDHQLVDNEELIKKKQLGGVGYLLNGNMCFGIYDDNLVVRIGKSLARTLINRPGIQPYISNDDDFDDFIMVEPAIYEHSKALNKFLTHSLDFTSRLPAKQFD